MPKLSSKLSSILLLLLVLALAACSGGGGGGSDGGSDPADDTPDDTPDDNTSEVTLQAIAGPDQSVNEGDEVLLEGSGAVSDTNLSLSYSWQQVGGSAVTLAGGDGQVASFSPTVDADSELSFRLLVQTETGLEATDDLVVSVNNAPTAVSESASSVVEGFAVSLNGWQSLDSDAGSVVAYEWAQLSGASVELSYVDEASVSFTAPWVSGNENLSFELAVTDDDGAIGRATAVIEVLDDTESPSISAIALAAGNYGIGASITLTLTAANSESGLTLKDGSSFNGQELTDFSAVSGQAGSYTATYTVAESDPSRDDGDSVSANIVLLDPAGNESAGIAEVALDGVRIDTLPPAIDSISVSAGDYGIGADVEITLIAADAESDLSLRAGSTFNGQKLANFAALDGQAGYYSAIYTVASGDPDLAATAKVGMSLVVLDAAGNASSEYETATLSSSTSIDANAPVVASIGVASGDYGIGDEIRIIITAAEAETDLSLSAAANSFNGGTLSQFAHIDSGIYSAIYTVTEGDNDVADNSSASINIALVDAYGNAGAAVSSVLLSNSSIDATKPELSPLSISNGVYGIGSNLVLFLSAAADEVGLELLDSTFNGQNLTGFSDLQNGLYALTYTVAAGDTDRADGVDVAAEISVVDLVGNISQDITSISLSGESIDANAPTIESISVAAGVHGIGDAVKIVISALETGLTLAAGSTFNGQELTGFSAIDGQAGDYVVTYTVAEGDSNGSDAGWVDSNIALVDAASNLGEALESVSLGAATIDAHRPEIADIDVATGEFGVGAAVAITLTASNAETGLVLVDGSSFNRVLLSGFGDNGDGTYNVTYTVSEGDLDIADGGTVITDIAFTDDAGNVGASIESLLFAGTSIDANSPSIALVSVAAGSYGVGAVIPVTITASAKELGLTLSSSSFNGRSLTDISDNLDGNYSASYTVEEGDADVADGSAVTINLAFEDAYANVGAAKESLILSGASIDANSPTITSVSVATGTFIIGDAVLITITAGDSENGLELKPNSSFHGQQLSAFSATEQDGVYTAIYTVAAEDASLAAGDTVSLDIALLDAADNGSAAETEVVLGNTTIDTTVPSIYEVSVSSDNIVNSSDDLSKVSVTGSTSNVEDGRPLTLDIGGITTEISVIADDDDNGGFSTAVDLSSLGDGTHPITIDVADSSGNEAQFIGEFIKDIEPPTIDSVVVSGDDIINSSDTLSAVSVSVGTTGVEDDQNVSLNIGGVMLELAITSNAFDGTVDLSGLGDSTEISVSGNVSDVAGNAAATFTKASSVIKDTEAPRIDSVSVSDDDVINSSDTLSAVAVSVSTTGVEDGQKLSLAIGGVTADVVITSNGFDGTVDLSELGDGTEIVVRGDVSDVAGNAAATFTKDSFVLKDTVAPSIDSVIVVAGTYKVGDPILVTLTASNSETGLSLSSKTFNGQSLGEVTDNNDGTYTTSYIVVEGDSDVSDGGDVVVDLEFSDVAGNVGTSTTLVTLASGTSIDANSPSIASVEITDGAYIVDGVVGITITATDKFSDVTGLTLSSNSFNGGSLGAVTDNDDGTYTTSYTVVEGHADVADGVDVVVALGFTDAAGNVGAITEVVSLSGESIDANSPTIASVEITDGAYIVDGVVGITITAADKFNDITGLTLSSNSFNGGSLGEVTDNDDGTYTTSYTVVEGHADVADGGDVVVALGFTDAAGNVGTITEVVSLSGESIDANSPTIASVEITDGAYIVDGVVGITITAADKFNDITGLTLLSNSFNGGSLGAVTDNNDGTYTTSYTVVEGHADVADGGDVVVALGFTDAAGNVGAITEVVSLSGESIDANSPTIASVEITDGAYIVDGVVGITITVADKFNDITGLTLSSNSFNGGSLGEVTDNDDGTYTTSYTVVEGHADVADGGDVVVELGFSDAAGNVGAITEVVSLSGESIDANSPTIASVEITDGAYIVDGVVGIAITAADKFNDITGLTLSSNSFNGGSLGEVTDNNDGTYTTSYTVVEGHADVADGGDVVVALGFTDAAGNVGTITEVVSLSGESIDANSPTIASVEITDGAYIVDGVVGITITAADKFNDITGLTLSSNSFNGGSLGEVTDNNDGTYTTSYTVVEGHADVADGGDVVVALGFTDAAGNVGTITEVVSLSGESIDANSPTIASVEITDGAYIVDGVVGITITAADKFNDITGLTLSSNSFNGGSLGEVTDNNDGTYTTSYTVVEGHADVADGGDVVVALGFTDAAGNVGAITEVVSLSGESIDANSPTIASVEITDGAYIVGGVVGITITAADKFNDITGLTLSSNSFNGGSLGEVTDNDDGTYTTSYTVVEGHADVADGGDVVVALGFTDAAGNVGTITEVVSLSGESIDANSPTIASVEITDGAYIVDGVVGR